MSEPFDHLKEVLAEAAPAEVGEILDRVYLFVSFDLVEATAFKVANPNWPVIISKFYELCIREIQEISSSFRLWKLAGDEVLAYIELTSYEELANNVKSLHVALNKVVDQLHNTFKDTRGLLSAKGTVWIARAKFIVPQKMQEALSRVVLGSGAVPGPVNIRLQVPLDPNTNAVDFLGPDIDVGFRIAQFAVKKILVVNANLAYILMSRSPRSFDVSNLRVVSLEMLKGVWNGRPYPIIWYHDEWDKIQDTFYYDELSSPIAIKILQNKADDVNILTKIYKDLNRTVEIAAIEEALKIVGSTSEELEEIEANPAKLAEVHCAAVCFRDDGRILIGRRPSGKRRLKGIFEFGCGQLKPNQSFEECIREGYKEDFGADLDHISPLPVNVYVIEGTRRIPGLLFYAELKNPEEIEERYLRSKHTEIQWFDPSTLEKIDKKEYVPDFDVTVSNALREKQARAVDSACGEGGKLKVPSVDARPVKSQEPTL